MLDLDETLVHSSFKPIPNPDYIIPVEIEGKIVDVYVLKRPWLDHFMAAIAGQFEIVVFTASLSKYAGDLVRPWCKRVCTPATGPGMKLGRWLLAADVIHHYVLEMSGICYSPPRLVPE